MPPFGIYESLEDCINQNQDKDDPEAYCAALELESKNRGVLPSISSTERRSLRVAESRIRLDEETRTLRQYAAVFNSPWDPELDDMWGFKEIVRPGAFRRTIAEDEIALLFNHDENFLMGRNVSGTLRLLEDDVGLLYEAVLPETSYARDLMEVIRRGDLKGASFSFTVRDEEGSEKWTYLESGTIRELLDIKIYDVSPVTFPAYLATNLVSARALRSAQKQKPLAAPAGRAQRQMRLGLARKRLELIEKTTSRKDGG